MRPAAAGQRIDLGGGAALEGCTPRPVHRYPQLLRPNTGNGRPRSVLITGDLDIQAQRRLASSPEASRILAAQVLKVLITGLPMAWTRPFLEQWRPK